MEILYKFCIKKSIHSVLDQLTLNIHTIRGSARSNLRNSFPGKNQIFERKLDVTDSVTMTPVLRFFLFPYRKCQQFIFLLKCESLAFHSSTLQSSKNILSCNHEILFSQQSCVDSLFQISSKLPPPEICTI